MVMRYQAAASLTVAVINTHTKQLRPENVHAASRLYNHASVFQFGAIPALREAFRKSIAGWAMPTPLSIFGFSPSPVLSGEGAGVGGARRSKLAPKLRYVPITPAWLPAA
jgi:hypothetical protein